MEALSMLFDTHARTLAFWPLARRILVLAALSLPLASPGRALAQGSCPPGFIPGGAMVPGQENAGWTGCLQVGPGEDGGGGGGGANDPSPSPPPFSAKEFAALIEWEKANAREAEERRMKSDPVYAELKQGVWKFGRPNPGDTRQTCQASFLQFRGGVLLSDWTGENKGTFMAFFGAGIPVVKSIRRETVSLTQGGETQTVQAFHAPFPWAKGLGMIIFAVPSTQALLSNIDEREEFSVAMGGRRVIQGAWHSGSKARNWLANCVNKRRRG